MAKGKARELNKEERRITGSRPEHARTPLPLSTNGVITKVAITRLLNTSGGGVHAPKTKVTGRHSSACNAGTASS